MIEAAVGNLIDMQLSLAQETSRGYQTLKKMLLWILFGCTAGNFTAMIYFVITEENSTTGSLTGPHQYFGGLLVLLSCIYIGTVVLFCYNFGYSDEDMPKAVAIKFLIVALVAVFSFLLRGIIAFMEDEGFYTNKVNSALHNNSVNWYFLIIFFSEILPITGHLWIRSKDQLLKQRSSSAMSRLWEDTALM